MSLREAGSGHDRRHDVQLSASEINVW
jgi:hypothetical protein